MIIISLVVPSMQRFGYGAYLIGMLWTGLTFMKWSPLHLTPLMARSFYNIFSTMFCFVSHTLQHRILNFICQKENFCFENFRVPSLVHTKGLFASITQKVYIYELLFSLYFIYELKNSIEPLLIPSNF